MFVGNIPLHADAGGYKQLRKDFVGTFCRMIDEQSNNSPWPLLYVSRPAHQIRYHDGHGYR